MNIIDIARECGAVVAPASGTTMHPRRSVTFFVSEHDDQLAALESRIRADEREKLLARMKSRYYHEVAAVVHHSKSWYAAQEYHMTRQAAMSDLIDVVRNSVHSDAAPVAEPESMNSHLTDADGSQVQAR